MKVEGERKYGVEERGVKEREKRRGAWISAEREPIGRANGNKRRIPV